MFVEACPICFVLLVPEPACAARRAMVVKQAGLTGSTVHKTGVDGFFHSSQIPHIGTNGNSMVILFHRLSC